MNGNSPELTLAAILRLIYMAAWNKFQYNAEREFLSEHAFTAADMRVLAALRRAVQSNLAAAQDAFNREPLTADPSEEEDWEAIESIIKEQMRRVNYR